MPGKPRVFISYARSDGEAFATALRLRLEREEPEITLWQDRAQLEGGRGWWPQILDALEQVEFLVLVMTPAALASPIVRREWKAARQRGVCVYPVVASDNLDFSAMPRWMANSHFYHLDKEWETFVSHLKASCNAPRVPSMPAELPAGYVNRTGKLDPLLDALLKSNEKSAVLGASTEDIRARNSFWGRFFPRRKAKTVLPIVPEAIEERQNPSPCDVAIVGPGGFGKTTLAAALCHDEDIITAYDAGILWVTLGENPNVLNELIKLHAVLTGERPPFVDEQDAALALATVLDEGAYLLVVDDVWQERHLRPFLRGGPNCARLVTTRQFDIASTLDTRINVDEMTSDEAMAMLTGCVEKQPSDLHPFRQLAARLGEWPLLLKLARDVLAKRLDHNDTLERALAYLNKALDRRGSVAFDRRNPDERNDAVAASLGVSLDLLDADEQQRYLELAIFPDNVDVPISALAALWGLDEFEVEQTRERLANLSLLDLAYDLHGGTIRLHDVIRAYLGSQLQDSAALHSRLVDGWADLHNLPDAYAWRWVGYHLVEARWSEKLRDLLLDFTWLDAKVRATDANALTVDCQRLPRDKTTRCLTPALRQASHALLQDPDQLAPQLLGRLLDADSTEIRHLLAATAQQARRPALLPCAASLHEHDTLIRTLQGHTGSVYDVAVTPDGERAISASFDNTLKVWDLASGQELRTLQGHTLAVHSVTVTPDGERAISVSRDNTLIVWDLTSGQNLLQCGEYTTNTSERITFCNFWRVLWVDFRRNYLYSPQGHTDWISSVVVTLDGERAISASHDQTLKVWDLASGKELRTIKGHTYVVMSVAVTPDGERVISASLDSTLKMWDLASGQELSTFQGHTRGVMSVAMIPDGERAISASDRALKVWDLASGQELRTLHGHTDWVNGVAVMPDGERAISASEDNTLKVWDLASGQELRTLHGHTDLVNGVAVTPDGERAISASSDNTLRVWNLAACLNGGIATGDDKHNLQGHKRYVYDMAVTPDGRRAISASYDNTLKVWDIESGQEERTLQGHTSLVMSVAVTPDGRRAISASYDNTLKVWDLASGQELRTLLGHKDYVHGVTVTPGGGRAVSASFDNTLRIWDMTSGRELRSCGVYAEEYNFLRELSAYLREMHLHSLRRILAIVSSIINWIALRYVDIVSDSYTRNGEKPVSTTSNFFDDSRGSWRIVHRLVDTMTNALQGHTGWVMSVAVTPDGEQFISASADNTLKVWNLDSGQELRTLQGHTSVVRSVAVTPDGERAISASEDNTLKVWDLASGQELRTLQGHTDRVNRVELMPDGRQAISASEDNTLKIWDIECGECMATFIADSAMYASAVCLDGKSIVGGGASGRVHFLRLIEDEDDVIAFQRLITE